MDSEQQQPSEITWPHKWSQSLFILLSCAQDNRNLWKEDAVKRLDAARGDTRNDDDEPTQEEREFAKEIEQIDHQLSTLRDIMETLGGISLQESDNPGERPKGLGFETRKVIPNLKVAVTQATSAIEDMEETKAFQTAYNEANAAKGFPLNHEAHGLRFLDAIEATTTICIRQAKSISELSALLGGTPKQTHEPLRFGEAEISDEIRKALDSCSQGLMNTVFSAWQKYLDLGGAPAKLYELGFDFHDGRWEHTSHKVPVGKDGKKRPVTLYCPTRGAKIDVKDGDWSASDLKFPEGI